MEPEAAVAAARRLSRLELPALSPSPGSVRGADGVERLLPHRRPFRFVDDITGVDPDVGRIRGHYDVDADDPVFRGHFPGDPVLPGVLQVEAIGQLGLCLANIARTATNGTPAEATGVRAVRVHHAVFLHPVAPGDRLELYAELLDFDGLLGTIGGQARVGEHVCSAAILAVHFV